MVSYDDALVGLYVGCLRELGECHNMRQGVMGNASIFARELGGTSDLVDFYYYYFVF